MNWKVMLIIAAGIVPTMSLALVIGDAPLDEIIIWQRDTVLHEDIEIINSGQLLIRGASLSIYGSISVIDRGRFSCSQSGKVIFLQSNLAKNSIKIANNALMSFSEQSLNFVGVPLFLEIKDKASLQIFSTVISNGELEIRADGESDIIIQDSKGPFVLHFWGSSKVRVLNSQNLELILPVELDAQLTISNPGANVTYYQFPTNATSYKNINAQLLLDKVSDIRWGFDLFANSKLTASGGNYKVCWFNITTPLILTNLRPIPYSNSHTFGYSTSGSVQLTNTAINNIAIYLKNSGNTTLRNCQINRLIQSGTTNTTIEYCDFDNASGYLVAAETGSQNYTYCRSMVPLYTFDAIKVKIAESTFENDLVAYDDAKIMANNSNIRKIPLLHDSASYIESYLDLIGYPLSGKRACINGFVKSFQGDNLQPLNGVFKANIYRITDNSVEFDSTAEIDGGFNQVELCWQPSNTGKYLISLKFVSSGDSIESYSEVFVDKDGLNIADDRIDKVLVNYQTDAIVIDGKESALTYSLYDLKGREWARNKEAKRVHIIPNNSLTSGIYYLIIRYDNQLISKKCVVLRN